jgi:hypothetical protein
MQQPKNMFELQQFVLTNVSDHEELFKKELKKSFKFLTYKEIRKLHEWVLKEYGNKYMAVIEEAFEMIETP